MRGYRPALLTTVSALLLAGGLPPAGAPRGAGIPAAASLPRLDAAARRGTATRGRRRAHGRAGADRPALRAGEQGRVPAATAGADRQAGPAPRPPPQGRDARELP